MLHGARHIPFGRIPLLLHLREDALGLVIYTMRTGGHLSVTLDLLLPTHITSLHVSLANMIISLSPTHPSA